LLTLNLST